MIRRVGIAATSSLAAGVIALVAAAPALAAPADDPVSGDPRATAYSGNVTKCSEVPSLKGSEDITVEATIDPTNTFVTITKVPDGFELAGTVVKGGPAYNVYLGDVRTLLHAPLVGQDKNIPTISHWFACGKKKVGSTTTTTTTTKTTTTTTTSGNGGGTTTTSPAGQGGNGSVSGTGLANTGYSTTGPLIAGGSLLLLGGGLLYLLRRTRRQN